MGFEPVPNPRFTEDRGTVTDHLTRLIWMRDANCFGSRTWNNALSDCNNLQATDCGITEGSNAGDWRLPNRFELESLVDIGNDSPALPFGHPFIHVQSSGYWSSSTSSANSILAWEVEMGYGSTPFENKQNSNYVWCVRGGQ